MRRRFDRARRAFSRARELIPLTNLGVLVAAAGALAWTFFALPRFDYVLRLVSVLAIALVAVALLAVIAGAILVHRSVKHRRLHASIQSFSFDANASFDGMKMPAFRFLPLIEVSWTWIEPERFEVELLRERGEVRENVLTHARAAASEVKRRFVIEDGFGLARIVLRRTEKLTLRVLPWVGELETAPMLRSLAGGDDQPHPLGELTGDRVDMRRYVAGDPLKLALWKIYARTGVLMVRTPERAIAPSVRVAAYLPASLGDEPPAAAARVAIEHGLLGEGWIFSADGANHPAEDVDGALSLIAGSRAVRGTEQGEAAGLARFLETTAEQEPLRVILFVPARPGPWIERSVAAVKKIGGSISVLIVTDGVEDESKKVKALERLLKVPAAPDPDADAKTTPAMLAEVARAFTGAGPSVQVMALERPTGRTLPVGSRGSRRVA
jgi:hypothetical protein